MLVEYKPVITLGAVIQAVALVGAGLGVYITLTERVSAVEAVQKVGEVQRVERNVAVDKKLDEFSATLEKMDKKLDRIIYERSTARTQ